VSVGADLALMPEVDARAALRGRCVRLRVLAPVGTWLGVGRLRVLRAKEVDDVLRRTQDDMGVVELLCGYESYERMP
jgi:hypothetical protein